MNIFKRFFGKKEELASEPVTLLEEICPLCPITAIVEQDERVAYLYLWGPEGSDFGVKSCWIRNLQAAPEENDPKSLEKGIPPIQPKQYCTHAEGHKKLLAEDLSIVWLEEGDGCALLEKDEILAIIPSWSGMGGFFGYARDAVGQGDFAWEMGKTNELIKRVEISQSFWKEWGTEMNPFMVEQPQILDLYDELFGKSDKYFAIDGGEWPPKGMYLRQGEVKTVFATVGLSLFAQPVVESFTENRSDLNRIELGLMLDGQFSDLDIQSLGEWVSGQAAIPWDHISFLGEGHTLTFHALDSQTLTNALISQKLTAFPPVNFPAYKGSPVNFFWMVPISEKERSFAVEKGSQALIDKLNELGNEIFSLERNEVV